MAKDFAEGDEVRWNWGTGTGTGKVAKRYTGRITRTIEGAEITRNSTEDEPAFLIEQEDGSEVLKSGSELERV